MERYATGVELLLLNEYRGSTLALLPYQLEELQPVLIYHMHEGSFIFIRICSLCSVSVGYVSYPTSYAPHQMAVRVFNWVNVNLRKYTSMDVSTCVLTLRYWLIVVVVIAFALYYALSTAFRVAVESTFVLQFQVLQFQGMLFHALHLVRHFQVLHIQSTFEAILLSVTTKHAVMALLNECVSSLDDLFSFKV